MDIREYFKDQLIKCEGHPSWKVYYLEQIPVSEELKNRKPKYLFDIELEMKGILPEDIDKLNETFIFVRMVAQSMPVLKSKL